MPSEPDAEAVVAFARRLHAVHPIIGDGAHSWQTLEGRRQHVYEQVATAIHSGSQPDLRPWLAAQREALAPLLARERFVVMEAPDPSRPDTLNGTLTAVRRIA